LAVVYDGDGNRASKTGSSGTTQYLVDEVNPTGYAQVVDELQSGTVSRTLFLGLELIDQSRPQPSPAPAKLGRLPELVQPVASCHHWVERCQSHAYGMGRGMTHHP
jgi:hypothetical protein